MSYSVSNNYPKINMNYFYKNKKNKIQKNLSEQLNINYNVNLIQKRMSNKEKRVLQYFWPNYSFKRLTLNQKFKKEDNFKKLNSNWIKFYNN